MSAATTSALLARLDGLRTELVDLAYRLDRRGSCAAADVALTASVRLGELYDDFSPMETRGAGRPDSARARPRAPVGLREF